MEVTAAGCAIWRKLDVLTPSEKRVIGFSPTTREVNLLGLLVENWTTVVHSDEWTNGGEDRIPAGMTGRQRATELLPVAVVVILGRLAKK
jgi:hypothetical protein